MTDKLQQICNIRREQIEWQKTGSTFAIMDIEARAARSPRGFERTLKSKVSQGGIGLITEIKKASPSAGLIRPDFDPAALANAYESGGAACLSVLTEATHFQGNNDHLIAARAACALPVLRKDFMLDVWQVAESRAIGADCILLIMAALDDAQAADLHAAAADYGMDVLIETHNRAELDRALRLPASMIGINNRNLKTLTTDLAATEDLAPLVPKDRLIVSESGIKTADDIRRMRAVSVNCFLVGESLLKQGDVTKAVKDLLRSDS